MPITPEPDDEDPEFIDASEVISDVIERLRQHVSARPLKSVAIAVLVGVTLSKLLF